MSFSNIDLFLNHRSLLSKDEEASESESSFSKTFRAWDSASNALYSKTANDIAKKTGHKTNDFAQDSIWTEEAVRRLQPHNVNQNWFRDPDAGPMAHFTADSDQQELPKTRSISSAVSSSQVLPKSRKTKRSEDEETASPSIKHQKQKEGNSGELGTPTVSLSLENRDKSDEKQQSIHKEDTKILWQETDLGQQLLSDAASSDNVAQFTRDNRNRIKKIAGRQFNLKNFSPFVSRYRNQNPIYKIEKTDWKKTDLGEQLLRDAASSDNIAQFTRDNEARIKKIVGHEFNLEHFNAYASKYRNQNPECKIEKTDWKKTDLGRQLLSDAERSGNLDRFTRDNEDRIQKITKEVPKVFKAYVNDIIVSRMLRSQTESS